MRRQVNMFRKKLLTIHGSRRTGFPFNDRLFAKFMNHMRSFFKRHFHFQVPCRIAVALIVLAWGASAFCDEDIYDAASKGDLAQVKALVKADPKLVLAKDDDEEMTA